MNELDPLYQKISSTFYVYWERSIESAPQIVAGLLILVVFYIIAGMFQRITARSSALAAVDESTTQLLASTVKLLIISLGVITALGTMGVNVGGLIAGLGLTGFALGLALKDILSNLVGGFLVLIYKPFQRMDTISVAGQSGRVREVNLRYTKIVDLEGNLILIPNAKLFSEIIRVERETQVTSQKPGA